MGGRIPPESLAGLGRNTHLSLLGLMSLSSPAEAAVGDTTWVRTFDHDFINWATPHVQEFDFPDTSHHSQQVLLYYRLECPAAPGDCDPWDRLGYLQVLRETALGRDTEPVEIARIVTPYDITGSNYPGSCTWVIDVSDYEPLLHGRVTLSNYIESWIGGERGWIVTLDFAFIEGQPEYKPYQIINLWQNYWCVYGDPSRPIEDVLRPIDVPVEAEADLVKVRVITTGHGQGNTGNCAEFCSKVHSITVNGTSWEHNLWRADCSTNPCSPQGGTWRYPRAGWCPGADVVPWDVDVTAASSGSLATIDYSVTPYENFCRPNNPNCVSGQTCPDCNYNYNGHTEPFYAVQGQLILYEHNAASAAPPAQASHRFGGDTRQVQPTRFPGWIGYELAEGGLARLAIIDAGGRLVRDLGSAVASPGPNRVHWDGRDDAGRRAPAGLHFLRVRAGSETVVRRTIVIG